MKIKDLKRNFYHDQADELRSLGDHERSPDALALYIAAKGKILRTTETRAIHQIALETLDAIKAVYEGSEHAHRDVPRFEGLIFRFGNIRRSEIRHN